MQRRRKEVSSPAFGPGKETSFLKHKKFFARMRIEIAGLTTPLIGLHYKNSCRIDIFP